MYPKKEEGDCKKGNIPAMGCKCENVQRALKGVAFKTARHALKHHFLINVENERSDHSTSNFRNLS